MIEQFKVLSAALALSEFTVEQLTARAGVSEATVRSVLARKSDKFETVRTVKTGRAGGSPKTYRLQLAAAAHLKDELLKLQEALPAADRPRPPRPDTLALDTAEEFLSHRLEHAKTMAERREILEIAGMNIDSTRVQLAAAHVAGEAEDAEIQALNRRLATLGQLHKMWAEQQEVLDATERFRAKLHADAAEAAAAKAEPAPSLYDSIKALGQHVVSMVGDSLQGQEVLVVSASADNVATAVNEALTVQAGMHVVQVKVDTRRDIGAQLRDVKAPEGHQFAGVIMAVDSRKMTPPMMTAAQQSFGSLRPVVLDAGDHAVLRNVILTQQGVYQAACASLEPGALLGAVKRPLLDGVYAALIGQAGPQQDQNAVAIAGMAAVAMHTTDDIA